MKRGGEKRGARRCQGLTFKLLLINSSKQIIIYLSLTVSLLTDIVLPLEGSLLLWLLPVPTTVLCRYCSFPLQ